MFTPEEKNAVHRLVKQCFNNPVKNAAREARKQYILELMSASYNHGVEIVDRESPEWLNRLVELCGPHAEVEDIARWYKIEKSRLEKLVG